MKQILIFGPTSWDTVVSVEEYPENGGFTQGLTRRERAGGAGLNIAVAVSSASIDTLLYSYVGTDEIGRNLKREIGRLKIDSRNIRELVGPSLHAVITVDKNGERTIFALEKNRFSELRYEIAFSPNQIVVFPVWRDFYLPYLEQANMSGATTVVGLAAIQNLSVKASLIIGSERDISKFIFDSHRFETAIITKGAEGVRMITATNSLEVPAQPVSVQDATGAGDSFLSGVLVGLAKGTTLKSAIRIGINWATAAITQIESVPPKWREDFHLE